MSITMPMQPCATRTWLVRLLILGALLLLCLVLDTPAHASCTVSGTQSDEYSYTSANINSDATVTLSGTVYCSSLLGTTHTRNYICMAVVFDGVTSEVNGTSLEYSVSGTVGGAGSSSSLTSATWVGPTSTVSSNDTLAYEFEITVPAQSNTLVAYPAGSYVAQVTVYWAMQITSLSCEITDALLSVNWSYGSTTLTATYTVPEFCLLNTTSAVNFGTLSEIGNAQQDYDAEGTINTTCNAGTTYTIYLGDGNNLLGSYRRMYNASDNDYLPYQLYQDSARTTVWDETGGTSSTGGTGGVSAIGTGYEQETSVYGRIDAGTAIPSAGTYTDSVVVTVTY